jgi:heme O synthase-like polyprenyltransferase
MRQTWLDPSIALLLAFVLHVAPAVMGLVGLALLIVILTPAGFLTHSMSQLNESNGPSPSVATFGVSIVLYTVVFWIAIRLIRRMRARLGNRRSS